MWVRAWGPQHAAVAAAAALQAPRLAATWSTHALTHPRISYHVQYTTVPLLCRPTTGTIYWTDSLLLPRSSVLSPPAPSANVVTQLGQPFPAAHPLATIARTHLMARFVTLTTDGVLLLKMSIVSCSSGVSFGRARAMDGAIRELASRDAVLRVATTPWSKLPFLLLPRSSLLCVEAPWTRWLPVPSVPRKACATTPVFCAGPCGAPTAVATRRPPLRFRARSPANRDGC